MRGKKFLAVLTAAAMAAAATVTSGISSVFAADGLGGFEWAATVGYQEGTTGVTNSNGTVSVSFENADNMTNVAGFCATTDGADWSQYDTLSFTVQNDSTSDISYAMAINTGSEWDWHQCDAITIGAGESKDLTFYLGAAEWWFGEELTAISNLYMVQRVNMMIMSPTADTTVSGSVTISDWALASNSDVNPVEPKDGFYVDGTVLRDANQNEFIMRGTNYAYTWYKWSGDEEQAIAEIAGYGANTIRIVLSNGAQYQKDSAGVVEHLIELCEKYNVVAVLEVHDVTGKDDEASLLGCAQYFAEIASALVGHEDTTIINIANEWQGTTNNSAWESAYINAVKIIRDAGLTHCIMCDAGGWGQGYSTVHAGGNAVLNADPEKNVMFSVHMYGTAGGNASTIKTVIDGAITRNLALCIGEFGYNHSDGDVDEDYIMQYCEEVNVGWLSWSWYGNGSPVEYLDMSNAQVGGTLSDWGDEVINGPYGWKATSEICSVYTGEGTQTETTTTTTTTETTTTTTTTTLPVIGIVLSESEIELEAGERATIRITKTDGSDYFDGQFVECTSDNPAVAVVQKSDIPYEIFIVGMADGTANITVYDPVYGSTANLQVTVTGTADNTIGKDVSIVIDSMPDKLQYNIGEELDLTGGMYHVVDDSTGENVYGPYDMTGVGIITDAFDNTAEGTYPIYISYNNPIYGCWDVYVFYVTVGESDSTTTIEPEVTIIYGDVNTDSAVDIIDVVRLARFISQDAELNPAFTDAQRTAADMNQDAYIDSSDLSLLCSKLAGL